VESRVEDMSAINGKALVKLVQEKVSELDDRELQELQFIVNREWEKRLYESLDLSDVFTESL